MNADKNRMDETTTRDVDALPVKFTMERFKVVDAGNGEVGLYNPRIKRFIRMHQHHALSEKKTGYMDLSKASADDSLPFTWRLSRFLPRVVRAGVDEEEEDQAFGAGGEPPLERRMKREGEGGREGGE